MKFKTILYTTIMLGSISVSSCNMDTPRNMESTQFQFLQTEINNSSHENSNVTISYPQISNTDSDDINNLIKQFVENIPVEYYGADYTDLSLEASYEITYYQNNLLSIVFDCCGYRGHAAHPNRFLSCLNINLENCSAFSLDDIYNVDENFVEFMYDSFEDQFLSRKLEELKIDESHELYDEYTEKLSNVKPFDFNVTLSDETLFYLSDEDLVICAGVIHAIGDYFEIKIKYPELRPFFKSNQLFTNISPFA